MSARERVVTFQGHHSYIVSIARLCKQNGLFTDVTLQCDDGKLLAHRIVLAAVSPFLRGVLIELPSGTQDFTIIVPDVRRAIVQQLLDFLYTGNMNVDQEATWELQELVHLLKIDPSNVGVVVEDDSCASRLANNGVCETVGVKIATRAELPAGARLPVSSPQPTPPLPRLTIKTEQQGPPHHLTNGLHRPAKTPPSRPSTRPKPLSSRPDYVESPPHSPTHHHPPSHSLTKKLSSPGRGGGKSGAVSPASSRGPSHSGQGTGGTRGGHASTNGGRPAHSPGSRPNGNGSRGGSSKVVNAKPRIARPEDHGDSRVVVGPSENSNVITSQESLKIKIITNRKRRMSSDTPSSSPSYSSSLSPGSRLGDSGSIKRWSGEGTNSLKSRANEAGTNGKRGRGVRTRGRARGRGGESRGGGRGARGLHDWENERTWVCAICGQYDPVHAAGATTEWIGCDCNRWFHKFCTKLKYVGDDFSCGLVHKVCLSS